jgi:hypothetical protein
MPDLKIEALCPGGLSGLSDDLVHETRGWSRALTVLEGQSALDVARQIDKEHPELVIVVAANGRPVGVVAPDPLVSYLSGVLGQRVNTLTDALTNFKPSDFVDVRTAYRPPLYYCSTGKHYSTYKPCPQHS